MIEHVVGRMKEAVRVSQRALESGEAEILETQTIIWFQERIKIWVELLEEYQSSNVKVKQDV